jgi:transposase
MHYQIEDTTFGEILKYLKGVKGIHKEEEGLRRFIRGCFYVNKTGGQWRLLPEEYGHWRAVHKRFKLWGKADIWKKMFEYMQKDPDMEWVMIDSTIVRAHACSAGYGKNTQKKEALGRSKGGFTTKIHALVDALGNPLKFIITAGQCNDITQAHQLIEGLNDIPIIADKAYDALHFTQRFSHSCIPSRKNRLQPRFYDKILYKERHAVECFFGKMKHFRRVFSRFDKSALSYLSFLYFTGTLLWLR